MYAGLRLGEVMALQKQDLANGEIRVCKAVVWHGNSPEIEEPKTESAYRTVPILKPLQDALAAVWTAWPMTPTCLAAHSPTPRAAIRTPGCNTAPA